MANPPPVRPWFRLASIRSNPTPLSAPAPAPAPVTAPPQEPRTNLPFRTASAPSSPQTQPPQEPSSQPNKFQSSSSSSSLPTSPVQKATVPTSSPEKKNDNNTRVPTPSPKHSPKIIKQSEQSPMHSPKYNNNNNKPTAPPPSPLTLPPSQLKPEPNIPEQPEPKTVLVQKTIDRPKPSHNNHTSESHKYQNNSHHGKHQLSESKEKGGHRKHSDSEESGMRVITIAGENRGAYMELIQSPKKHEPKYLHKKGNSNVDVDGVESENLNAEEGNVNKNHKGRTTSSFPMAAYMNSNVQCVNNSLLYHTSCSHHDPGVRLSLSKKPFAEGFHVKEHAQSHHA